MTLIRALVAKYSKLLNQPWNWTGPAPDIHAIGRLGEKIAAKYLYVRGCKILYRNYRGPEGGEVDIAVRHDKVLAFLEVKTRTSESHGRPAQAVNLEKRLHISRGVRAWLNQLHDRDIGWRCDIVEVLLMRGKKPKVRWILSAFTVEESKKQAASYERKKV